GYDFGLTRRTFVQVLGAGILIATAGPALGQQARGRGRGGFGQSRAVPVEARVHIGKDGVITVMTGKVEGGQGARAEITQAAAEELGVAVGRVGAGMPDTTLVPDDWMPAVSRTMPLRMLVVRHACGAARGILGGLAAMP